MTIILRDVPGYGWLASIERDDKEIYRGEYQITPTHALIRAQAWMEEQHG